MSASTMRRVSREPVAGHARSEDFRHRAMCREVDPDLFYPVAEQGPDHDAQVGAAKAVCARCPVREACLAWALRGLPYGIAGGMTEHERRTEGQRRRGSSARPITARRTSSKGEGPGWNQALHQISQHGTQVGTRAEGHRR